MFAIFDKLRKNVKKAIFGILKKGLCEYSKKLDESSFFLEFESSETQKIEYSQSPNLHYIP
ncbi:unnamed protein product [Trichogramma brassicae]|uniref:Uncharacterized protein n=1 Tax=Trichogramma brassicae TaxID=86971 RepID=A0A6H5IWP6_9HYME|nr:unnamed protein product [Trichogramma brassicae]